MSYRLKQYELIWQVILHDKELKKSEGHDSPANVVY